MPLRRYVFADLDALSRNARACMQGRASEFSPQELAETCPLDPHKLTTFLSVADGVVKLLRGCSYDLTRAEMEGYQAAGWDVRAKSAPEHPTLENLLKRNLADDDSGRWGDDTKTLVLAGSELTETVLSSIEKYFDAGWRVRLYCFRAHGEIAVDNLRSKHPSDFQNVFLDRFISFLQKEDGATSVVERPQDQVAVKAAPKKQQTQRFVFMDLDGINDMIFKSWKLYKKVPGAKGVWAIRINYSALTDLVCSGAESKHQRRVVTFAHTIPTLSHVLYTLGWATKKLARADDDAGD
jgi:hypothetical protein